LYFPALFLSLNGSAYHEVSDTEFYGTVFTVGLHSVSQPLNHFLN